MGSIDRRAGRSEANAFGQAGSRTSLFSIVWIVLSGWSLPSKVLHCIFSLVLQMGSAADCYAGSLAEAAV